MTSWFKHYVKLLFYAPPIDNEKRMQDEIRRMIKDYSRGSIALSKGEYTTEREKDRLRKEFLSA